MSGLPQLVGGHRQQRTDSASAPAPHLARAELLPPRLPQAQTQDPLNRAYKWGGRVPDAGPIAPFALHNEPGAQPGQSQPPSRGQQQAATSEPGFSGRTGGRVPNWIAYDRKVSLLRPRCALQGYYQLFMPWGSVHLAVPVVPASFSSVLLHSCTARHVWPCRYPRMAPLRS